jgi:diketogulonate reductase-like aldo/keto reductase
MSTEDVTKQTEEHIEQCLKELGVGYIDLLLMHWPSMEGQSEEISRQRRLAAWRVFETFYERGWVRAIGVSNFSERHLQQLMDDGAKVLPMVNQIEASPYLQFNDIVSYCQDNGIVVQSYSPLGSGVTDVKDNVLLKELASHHQKDVGQIAFRYLIQKGYAVAYLTNSETRMESNQNVFDFLLSKEEMKQIDTLNHVDGGWGLPSPYDLP